MMRNIFRPSSLTAGVIATTLLAAGVSPAAAAPIPLEATGAPPERVILNPTEDPSTSQTVTWRSVGTSADVPARAELRLPDGQVRTVEARVTAERTVNEANAVTFSVTFTDLTPSTSYAYRAITGETADEWHGFTTAAASDEPFTFTWYADGQNDLTEMWTPIVELGNQAFPNSELTLQTGDLISNSVESEWEEWFTITDGQRQTENWLPAMGNHEYWQDVTGEYWHANFTLPEHGPLESWYEDDPHKQAIVRHLPNRMYYTDYQGVRFITLSSEIRNQAQIEAEFDIELPNIRGSEFRAKWHEVQADWLDMVLIESDANWHVVQLHHPVFAVAEGRDNPPVRNALLPVIQEHDVDLVLAGQDHAYARGYLDENETGTEGVTDGPVFVVSISGSKYYELETDEANDWLLNGATQVVKHAHTSFVHGLRATSGTLEYEAIVAQKGAGSTTDLELGETADSFTITRLNNGSKSVTEGIERRVATGLGESEGEPVEGDIAVEATVPENIDGPGVPGGGILTLTVEGEARVDLGEGRNAGDRWSFNGVLPTLSVTDSRTEAAGWSLTGTGQDLSGGTGSLSAAFLGWVPRVLEGATAQAGPKVAGELRGGEGLEGPRLLASANDHSRFGTTELIADLALDVPISSDSGDYQGAINVTLFPVD